MSAPAETAHETVYRSTDPAEIEQFGQESLGIKLQLTGCPDDYYWSQSHLDAGSVSIDRVSSAGLFLQVQTTGSVLVVTGERGLITREVDGVRQQIAPGESGLGPYGGQQYRSEWTGDEPCATVVRLDLDLVRDVAASTSGTRDVEFTGFRPVSPAAERQWQETVDLVSRTLRAAAMGPPASPVVGEARRFLAAVALSTFPNTAGPRDVGRAGPDGGGVVSETVRRAVDHIEANVQHELTVADIATAAGVTPRALQLAFRRHLDTTPMAYLRRVRLAGTHDELREADPSSGTTVTEVSGRWGFCGSSRFTAYYRQAYGETPSETLAG